MSYIRTSPSGVSLVGHRQACRCPSRQIFTNGAMAQVDVYTIRTLLSGHQAAGSYHLVYTAKVAMEKTLRRLGEVGRRVMRHREPSWPIHRRLRESLESWGARRLIWANLTRSPEAVRTRVRSTGTSNCSNIVRQRKRERGVGLPAMVGVVMNSSYSWQMD